MSQAPNFMICGNDCPNIIKENIRRIKRLYPNSFIYLYDWGHEKSDSEDFIIINSNLKIIDWPDANSTNYTFQKVRCINDCYRNHAGGAPLVFIDSDVVIYKSIDSVFNDSEAWDIGVTWRPETTVVEGVIQWINCGVIFMNNKSIKNTQNALNIWLDKCNSREDKIWYIDQIELCKICNETVEPDILRKSEPELIKSHISDTFSIKTFHFTEYNFLPSSNTPYPGTNRKKAKILHFKGKWRKELYDFCPHKFRKYIPSFILSCIGNKNITIRLLLRLLRKLKQK